MMVTVLHTPPNHPGEIDELFAILSIDEHGEGIVAATLVPALGMTTLVSARRSVVDQYEAIAQGLAKQTGRTLRLVRFERGTVIREWKP